MSNMSVAIVTAARLCSASRRCLFHAPSFPYQRAAGLPVPGDAQVLPADPGAGTVLLGLQPQAEGTGAHAVGLGKPAWGRGSHRPLPPTSLLRLPFRQAGEQMWPSSV